MQHFKAMSIVVIFYVLLDSILLLLAQKALLKIVTGGFLGIGSFSASVAISASPQSVLVTPASTGVSPIPNAASTCH